MPSGLLEGGDSFGGACGLGGGVGAAVARTLNETQERSVLESLSEYGRTQDCKMMCDWSKGRAWSQPTRSKKRIDFGGPRVCDLRVEASSLLLEGRRAAVTSKFRLGAAALWLPPSRGQRSPYVLATSTVLAPSLVMLEMSPFASCCLLHPTSASNFPICLDSRFFPRLPSRPHGCTVHSLQRLHDSMSPLTLPH